MSTPNTVKAQLQSLIAQSNATTGKTDATLTDAVASLVEGYGGSADEGYIELPYSKRIDYLFHTAEFPADTDLTVYVPNFNDYETNSTGSGWTYSFYTVQGVNSLTLICDNYEGVGISYSNVFNSSSFKKIDLTRWPRKVIVGMTGTFKYCYYLEEIIGELDVTDRGMDATFYQCYALREIRFKKGSINSMAKFGWCDKLSDETIQNIIDGLADLTGQDTQTITLHADVKAKLTEVQIATITNKNWTLA